jgi:AraC-like DNA-binding protein/transcriptional regulator with XRE-family HTH domain
MAELGTYINEIRKAQRYSVERFAGISHVSVENIIKIEQGKTLPSKWQLIQIAALSGISEMQLLIAHQQQLIRKGNKEGKTTSERAEVLIKELVEWQKKKSAVKLFPVHSSLLKYIESIVYFERQDPSECYEKVLPDGMSQLVINLDQLSSIAIGPHDIPHDLLLKKNVCKIIVRFQPYGLYLLTGIPQDKLLNRILDAEYIFSKAIVDLNENLMHCKDVNEIGTVINRFFISRIPTHQVELVETRVINFVVSHIDSPIAELVKKAGYSSKHLIHLFRTYTGLTPKTFQQVHQFTFSINEISLLPTHRLSGFNWSNHYFDQAHFNHQFKRFSGFTPAEYLNSGNTCPRMVLVHKYR